MELIELVGDRMFLDHLITSTFNFNYQDNKITVEYNSYLEIADIENKITILQSTVNDMNVEKEADQASLSKLTDAIQILQDLKSRLT